MWGKRKNPSQDAELPAEPKKRLVDVSSPRSTALGTATTSGQLVTPSANEPKPGFPTAPGASAAPATSSVTVPASPPAAAPTAKTPEPPSERSGVTVPPTAAAIERTAVPAPSVRTTAPTRTTIGEGMEIDGHVVSTSDLDVFGVIEGDVESRGHVQVHPRAVVKGMITAQSVNVEGHVEGDITTRARLYIGAAGRVEGDVQVKSLNVEEGGVLLGRCMMT